MMSNDDFRNGESFRQREQRRKREGNVEPLPMAANDGPVTLAPKGELLDSFVVHFFSGAVAKFFYGQVNWVLAKGGHLFIHMPYGGLVIRGRHLSGIAKSFMQEQVKEIRQGDIHADQHEKVTGPFIEEIVFMGSYKIEEMVGIGPMGSGFKGTIQKT